MVRIAILTATLSLSGCLSVHDGPRPELSSPPEGEHLAQDFELSVKHNHGDEGDHAHDGDESESQELALMVQRAIKSTGLVKLTAPYQRTLRVTLVEEERSIFALNLLSILTVTLIPSYSTSTFRLEMGLAERRRGPTDLSVALSAGTTTYVQFFLVFTLPFTNGRVEEEALRAITLRACAELRQRYAAREAARARPDAPRGP